MMSGPTLITTLKEAWPVFADIMFRFVSEDYNYDDIGGEGQVLLGTLLYNMSNILGVHNAESYISWLRSYDSFYTEGLPGIGKETKTYVIDNTQDDFIPNIPVAYINGKEAKNQYDGNQTLELRTTCGSSKMENDGVTIYYKVEKIGSNKESMSEYKLYYKPIKLSAKENCSYKITTFAMAFTNKSEETTYTIKLNAENDKPVTENKSEVDNKNNDYVENNVNTTIVDGNDYDEIVVDEMVVDKKIPEADNNQQMTAKGEKASGFVGSVFGNGSWIMLAILVLVALCGFAVAIYIKKKRM